MKKIDRLWKKITQENNQLILEYYKTRDSLIEFIRLSRAEESVDQLYWGLHRMCLRTKEFEEIQARKNALADF